MVMRYSSGDGFSQHLGMAAVVSGVDVVQLT
jgi:hypothetical protein